MSIELRHLHAFVEVADTLHFRRAAERLHLAQPALSRAIRQLEDRVGAPLLERSTRSVSLTPAGAALLPEARATLRCAERALGRARAAAAGHLGQLAVTYMDFAINGALPRILARFRRRHPGIRVSLRHLWTEGQREALLRGEVDVGFLIGPFTAPGVASRVVQREHLCVVLPEDHGLARRRRIPVAVLRDEPFVLGNPEAWAPFRHLVDRVCQGAGFSPRVVQEAFNSDGILGLVAAGLGVTLYPEGARSRQREGVVVRPLDDTSARVDTLAAWRSDDDSLALARFLESVREGAAPG